MENWFKFRLPYDDSPVSGMSPRLEKGIGNGFVFAPFSNPSKGIFTIPDGECSDDFEFTPTQATIPHSTTREDHMREVRSIVDFLAGADGKVVAARVIRTDTAIDLNATFEALDKAYPEAFVFMFSTPLHGTWIGASPELLLECDGDTLRTMALAGTRPVGTEGAWDAKNVREQQLVSEHIVKCLNRYSMTVSATPPREKAAGGVEHICTPIEAQLPQLPRFSPLTWQARLQKIVCDLSPTPAVCGSERTSALRLIEEFESFPRELYGGFCGPCSVRRKMAAFYVNLRSAKCSPTAVAAFAGGGITPMSNPEDEWAETELKSKTIISKIQTR